MLHQAPAAQFADFDPAALAAWRAWRPAVICCRPPAGPVPACQRRADRRPGRHRHDRAHRERRAGDRADPGAAAAPGGSAAAPARRAARPPLAAAIKPARGRFLRALDPDLGPADRIRYRTSTPRRPSRTTRPGCSPPGPPGDPAAALAGLGDPADARPRVRGRPVPQHHRRVPAAARPPGRATRTAITALHGYRSALATGTVLRALAGGGHDTVLTAISCLAGYLDSCGSPIDYQRRRDLIPAGTITARQWRDLCYGAAAHPGEARRHRDAQRYLFQLLTGADLHDPRHALAFTTGNDYSHYQAFAGTLPTGLRDALHGHAAALLHDLGIGEPLTWAPPPGCCARLTLPGPEPDDIDLDAVGHLIITGRLPVADAAARLGTTTGHVRLALEHIPRPARQWGRSAAPPTWQRQQHARAILTREFFEREYIAAGKNLRQLEAETGIPQVPHPGRPRARHHHDRRPRPRPGRPGPLPEQDPAGTR